MSIQTLKTVRSTLSGYIQSDVTGLQTVYGYMPKTFDGRHPVCTIERLPVQHRLKSGLNDYNFAVTFWARTDGASGSGLTAANAEDTLDDLYNALYTSVKSRYGDFAKFYQDSAQYPLEMESGVVYQAETHFLRLSMP
jgi:hypothetical protein